MVEIELKIDPAFSSIKVIIQAQALDAQVEDLMQRISEPQPRLLIGFQEDRVEILDPAEITRIYAAQQKVYASAARGTYLLRLRLYELEERLERDGFLRISNSELINLRKVKNFDLSISGTIYVQFQNGEHTYVSRRYVTKIKSALGI